MHTLFGGKSEAAPFFRRDKNYLSRQQASTNVAALGKEKDGALVEEGKGEAKKAVVLVKKNNPVVIKVFSFGVGALLIAVNLTGNSLLLISDGHPGAGSLTTSFQALLLGVCGGTLMSGGVALGKPIGEKDFLKASEIATCSYILTAGLTAASTLAYGATYFIFPEFFSDDTAKAASTYFLVSALGNWPALALVTTGQIAFQCEDWASPLISTVMYRIPSVALSYLFSKIAHMSVAGVGLGNTIAPWLSYIGMQLWLKREEFQNLNQVPFSREIWKKHSGNLLKLGGKMSLQRITEWGNLTIVTTVLGNKDNSNLVLINPSLQVLTLFNLFSQGIGLGANMMLAVERGKMKKFMRLVLENSDTNKELIPQIKESQRNIKNISKKSLAGGLVVNGVLAGCLFFARKPIIEAFLPPDATAESLHIAETALWINGLSLVADALRIISGNLLNTWDMILLPNIFSLALMTAIGVPLGYEAGRNSEEPNGAVTPMFALRTGAILMAAFVNGLMLLWKIRQDDKDINDLETAVDDDVMMESSARDTLKSALTLRMRG